LNDNNFDKCLIIQLNQGLTHIDCDKPIPFKMLEIFQIRRERFLTALNLSKSQSRQR